MLDCAIIGTGPAGLSAAINLKTYKKDFVWFGSVELSDKAGKAESIVNYPGFTDITGKELIAKFKENVKAADLEITEKTVTNVMDMGGYFGVLANNDYYEAKTVILATGVMSARVLEGEEAYLGRGVSYCATCDGALYKGKKIAVICNTAKYAHEVEYLADLAEEVLFFPGYATDLAKENVKIIKDPPQTILGGLKADTLVLRSGAAEKVDGIFCLRDAIMPTAMFPGLLVEGGHVVVDRNMAANIPGCFACGDCTGRPYQYTKAVGEGNVAAHSVIAYLAEKK